MAEITIEVTTDKWLSDLGRSFARAGAVRRFQRKGPAHADVVWQIGKSSKTPIGLNERGHFELWCLHTQVLKTENASLALYNLVDSK